MFGRIFAAIAGLCLLAFAASAEAEPRVALVVGNSNYGAGIGKLANPANDAALMTAALQKTGFTVIKVIDANQKEMKRAIIEFGEKLANAGPKATGLFYYAGHGIQVKGMNYLIPVDANIQKEADVSIESLTADDVMEQMEFAANAVNIIILDACRNNPVSRSMRSATRGLAPMQSDSVRGTFIAYSTAPGQTAADGAGTNSPYSQALAKAIVEPGLGIEEIFRDVRGKVMQATEEKQIPWDSSSLTAPFYFNPNAAKPAAVTNAPAAPSSLESDKALWDGIKESKVASDYQYYLDQYPNGTFAGLAHSRLASLGATPAAATPAPTGGAKSAAEKAAWDSISASKQASDYEAYLSQYPQGTYAPLARSKLAELNRAAPAAQPVQPTVVPAAAPTPAAAPAAEPASASNETTGDGLGELFGSGPKVEYDSRGVDCRIMDTTRSDSDCRNTKKPKKANKPRS